MGDSRKHSRLKVHQDGGHALGTLVPEKLREDSDKLHLIESVVLDKALPNLPYSHQGRGARCCLEQLAVQSCDSGLPALQLPFPVTGSCTSALNVNERMGWGVCNV